MKTLNKDARDNENRHKKVAERVNREKRKSIRDRHFHVIDEDDEDTLIETRYGHLLKGKQ